MSGAAVPVAIKYTRKGRVLIALRHSGGSHRIEVHDTGPGLSGAAFEQAPMRNEWLERALAAAEGSGLGLAVVREIAEANGWTLTACAGRRTGASIRLDLPARIVRLTAPPCGNQSHGPPKARGAPVGTVGARGQRGGRQPDRRVSSSDPLDPSRGWRPSRSPGSGFGDAWRGGVLPRKPPVTPDARRAGRPSANRVIA